jgi:Predicted membrane protein
MADENRNTSSDIADAREIAVVGNSKSVASTPPHPLDKSWFMHVDGQNYGPFTGHQLRDFVDDGRLHPETDVCREGGDAWIKAKDDPVLATLFQSPKFPMVPATGPVAPSQGNVSAEKGATIVQVTNHIAQPQEPRPTIILEEGVAMKKSPGTALVLSILWVGLGQIYNGQVGKGFLMMFLCVLLWFVLLGWIINIWSWFDAYHTAKAMNERYERRRAAGVVL